jgi:hypothetical protein
MPVPDKNIILDYKLRFSGRELEAALQAFAEFPTYKDERGCNDKCSKKEKLRMEYMKLLLKKAA